MTLGELKTAIKNLPDDLEIYITSQDDMPLKIIEGIDYEINPGHYRELYINVKNID